MQAIIRKLTPTWNDKRDGRLIWIGVILVILLIGRSACSSIERESRRPSPLDQTTYGIHSTFK